MTAQAVEELLAKQAITEVLYRYCRALDRMDHQLALTCWHEGATVDYGDSFTGTAAGFLDWVWPVHRDVFDAHSHQITNILVQLDGDLAGSESYVTVTLRTAAAVGQQVDVVGRGRYLDQWSRRAGLWAIDRRTFITDVRSSYVPAPSDGSAGTGRRNLEDPSYDVLATPLPDGMQ